MSCPCCNPMFIGFYLLVMMLLLMQYFAVPALLSGVLAILGSFSAGVLFTPLVLMFQSSQFTVYEILFFIGCAHWLVSCVKLVRDRKFVDITVNFWWWDTAAPVGAACLFMIDLFVWYQLLGLFLIIYAGFVFSNAQSRVPHTGFFGSIAAFLAGFFGITGSFLTTPQTLVLDFFIIDTARLLTYLYCLNGLERLRESSGWGYAGVFMVAVGAASIIAGMMVVGQSMGNELGEIVRKKISARTCKIMSVICVLFLGVMLIRHGLQNKPKPEADVFWQQTQTSMNNVLRN